MKMIQTVFLAIALAKLFASCQSSSALSGVLSNAETRSQIMKEIANDTTMANEMIQNLMNNKNGMVVMQHHQVMMIKDRSLMMNLMKNNPGMMHGILSGMMETANGDYTIMSAIIETMMGNQQMMRMIQNRTEQALAK